MGLCWVPPVLKALLPSPSIKDWKKRLSYFLQNSSASSNVKASKGGKHHAYYR